jgi:multidrug efflux pump subunit AcrA (membrane-fusion protein)
MKTLIAAIGVALLIAFVHSTPGQDVKDKFGLGKFNKGLDERFRVDPNDYTKKLDDGTLVIDRSDITILPELQSKVAAKRPGVLKSVEPLRAGQMVEKDMVIATLDDGAQQVILKIAKEKAQDDVEKDYAIAVRDVAQAELGKYLAANKTTRIFSGSDIEQKRLEVKRSSLQIDKADRDKKIAGMEVEQALEELKTFKIEAPISGEVAGVEKHAGEAVALGDTIMVIEDLSRVRATGKIPIKYQHLLRIGQPVEVRITVSRPEEKKLQIESEVFSGTIYHIDHRADTVNRDIEIMIEVANKKDARGLFILREGYPVQLTIPPAKRT